MPISKPSPAQDMKPGALQRRLESLADTENSQITDRFLAGMLIRFLSPYKWGIVWVFILLIAVTALTLLLPILVQRSVDGPITSGNLEGLIPYGILYFVTIAVIFALRFWHTYALQTIGQNALVTLRQTLYEHILRQDMRFFNTTPVGQLVSRLSNDIDALTELLSTSIVMVASSLITLIGIIVTMFLLNWRLALLALVVMPVMIWATVYFRRKMRAATTRYHKMVATYLAFINEQFGGMLIVQLFGRQMQSRAEFQAISQALRDIHSEWRDHFTSYGSVLQFLTSVGFAIVLYGGGQGVLAGWASLGILIAFIEYTRRSFEPIILLSEQIAQIQTALSAGERIARMLRVEPEIRDPEVAAPVAARVHEFAFEHVTFGYEDEHPVLRDVNFHVPAGQRVAIVGATGAGKTSLAGLLARFYDVDSGRILIDGADVRSYRLEDLRRIVTVVPQNPYCFDGTIADNLRLFDPSITFEQMERAAKIASAAPFIERLPGGYDYPLLPGGANLSQGQRQLLALARALIHSPESILVLDEATSNIDTETEALIQRALDSILRARTSLIIAHRLSTIRDADRIIVLQRGQIVEEGTHDSLISSNGVYASMYQRQFDELQNIAQQSPS